MSLVMSKLHFMDNPFPDNHDGFDYNPQTEMDLHREYDSLVKQAKHNESEKQMKSMLASVFK